MDTSFLFIPRDHGYFFSNNKLGSLFCEFITDDPGWRPSKSETHEGEWTGKSSLPSRQPSSVPLAGHVASAPSCLKKNTHDPYKSLEIR